MVGPSVVPVFPLWFPISRGVPVPVRGPLRGRGPVFPVFFRVFPLSFLGVFPYTICNLVGLFWGCFMLYLTVRQPYASLILGGFKTVEYRSRPIIVASWVSMRAGPIPLPPTSTSPGLLFLKSRRSVSSNG